MYMTNLRPFVIAVAFGLIAVVLVYLYVRNIESRKATTEVQMVRVVRAVEDIGPRTTVSEGMLEEIEVPADIVTPDTVTEMEEILGQVSMVAIYGHEILMHRMFKEETALEDLARMLQEGERAVTVGVTEVSGLGGNLKPGDDVDVLVTILGNEEVGVPSTFTVLRNVDVMAVGQNIGFQEDENTGTQQPTKSVTLRVLPEQAELLALASEVGSLRLALRDPDDPFAPATDGTTLTEFTRYTPTRQALEEAARREREERQAAEARVPSPRETVVYQRDAETGEERLVPTESLGPPPILIELILGGESQMVAIQREK
jgi:pilus assembly protein CpaB